MSSWWQEALKYQLTGWSWRRVVPTSVPCSQVCRPRTSSSTPDIWLKVCRYFFLGNMSESKAHQVEIREVDGQTLRTLVDYIYTAEIEVTEDNVQVGEEEKHFCLICLGWNVALLVFAHTKHDLQPWRLMTGWEQGWLLALKLMSAI